ncbi:MAG: hypothetical protein H7Y00_15345 [Fimbriimonadaceae bacterium]|nr:hypothetical protein [Chitinophagales bacterium]
MKYILLLFFFFTISAFAQDNRSIHVFVALCDNDHQGISPVSKALGNGKDPKNNLYWGALYGVKTYFKNSANWQLIETQIDPAQNILERCIFKHKTSGVYLIADAYDGEQIQKCTEDFLEALSVNCNTEITVAGEKVETGGLAELIVYVGHNGLMDFTLSDHPENNLNQPKDAIILSCISKEFFSDALKAAKANPLIWTTGLMAPEAYTLEAAIEGWIKKESSIQIESRAATAYSKYQKCSVSAAKNLLATGW